MRLQTALDMLREIKDVAFATVDQVGKPQVRIIDIMLVENQRIYFCTARGKDFYKEIIDNKEVAITALNKEYKMVRLNGSVVRIDDSEQRRMINRIFINNPAMNDVYPGESRYILETFYIEDGEIEIFDLGKVPIERETLSMGHRGESFKGFFISNSCIGCGKCERNCPQKCIKRGKPYEIAEKNCLHCGLCYEICPVKAIKKRGKR